jgi:hypothetical protein
MLNFFYLDTVPVPTEPTVTSTKSSQITTKSTFSPPTEPTEVPLPTEAAVTSTKLKSSQITTKTISPVTVTTETTAEPSIVLLFTYLVHCIDFFISSCLLSLDHCLRIKQLGVKDGKRSVKLSFTIPCLVSSSASIS